MEGPTTALVILGILIDTVKGELRLPVEKLERLHSQIKAWLQKDRCTKLEEGAIVNCWSASACSYGGVVRKSFH